MTPREQYAEARRAGVTLEEMRRACRAPRLELNSDGKRLRDWLDAATPADDAGILSWRYYGDTSAPWDSSLWAELVNLNGETVADISRGKAGGQFYWRIYKPECFAITTDPDARYSRSLWGQDAIVSWGGPCRQRRTAATRLVDKLDRLSIALLRTDILMIPKFEPKGK